MQDSQAQPAPLCPPHRWRGAEQLCEHCGVRKGTIAPSDWHSRTIASHYQCDVCRAYAPAMTVMYQHGQAFLCADCHKGKVAADAPSCVICGEPTDGGETCGDGRSKCARRLRRRAERPAEQSDE